MLTTITRTASEIPSSFFPTPHSMLPHSMAGASYSFTLPIPAANQNGVTQYAIAYIIPTTTDVNVELTVGTWNEKKLIPVKPGSSVNYFAVAYTTKLTDPPTFNLNGDMDFVVISAVSCLPTSNGKCDYAAFMLTGVCDSNKVDWHPTDLSTSRKLSVTPNVPSNVCASTVKIYDDSNTVTDQITNASTMYSVAQTFGDRVILSTSFPIAPIRIGSLAASGDAFLTGLASTTQFVTGTTHFMTRTEKATVYIVLVNANQGAPLTISLDGKSVAFTPATLKDSWSDYVFTNIAVTSVNPPSLHTLDVSSGKYVFYVTGSQKDGHAYGYYSAFNKLKDFEPSVTVMSALSFL
ncbi:hypothetical protein PENTCL1PPCAC_3330 [Pristionchus entomophagus]|uniref:IgGFc-binding protein N-terminal domain-containing protein n=1 Tax=Pristionchus entomophagus TaxID=358040 RepID=A0AAV5SE16_9BILA|nr:hypothetical protein PENTCL1PPCAC_3330 [Pristionchus entomophagus]